MKKCKYCGYEYEGETCPMCGYTGEIADAEKKAPVQASDVSDSAPAAVSDTASSRFPSDEASMQANGPISDIKAPDSHSKNTPHPYNEAAAHRSGCICENSPNPTDAASSPSARYPAEHGEPGTTYIPHNMPYMQEHPDMSEPSHQEYTGDNAPLPRRKKYTAGTVTLSLLKAAGFAAFYFILMNLVNLAFSFVLILFHIVRGGGLTVDVLMQLVYSTVTPSSIAANALFVPLTVLFFIIIKRRPSDELGFHRTRGVYILYAAALGFAMQFVVTGTISLFPSVAEYYNEVFYEQYAAAMQAPLWMEAVNLMIFVPFAEEVLFRGAIYGSLRKGMPQWVAAAVTAAIFGLFHGNIVSFIYAALLSLLMTAVYEKTGSLFTTITLHAALNGASFAVQLVPEIPAVIFSVYILSILVAAAAAVMIFVTPRIKESDESRKEVLTENEAV